MSEAKGAERRRAQRAPLKLPGRFLLPDGGEHACTTVDASVTGLSIQAHMVPQRGERIVVYIDGLGRFDGSVVSRREDGFALELTPISARSAKLAQKLAALSGEARDFSYANPDAQKTRTAELRVAFGQTFHVQVSEETAASARIFANFGLLPGARVFLDQRPAFVLHENTGGFMIGFEERARRPL